MKELKSEQISIRSPLSIRGASIRCWRMYDRPRGARLWLRILAGVGVTLLMLVWLSAILLGWLFLGLFMIPLMWFGRGRRKRRLAEAQHRELLKLG